jgi:hypothetical protein
MKSGKYRECIRGRSENEWNTGTPPRHCRGHRDRSVPFASGTPGTGVEQKETSPTPAPAMQRKREAREAEGQAPSSTTSVMDLPSQTG